jgi:hypothetical protein
VNPLTYIKNNRCTLAGYEKRPLNCSVALRSNSSSVRYIKHNYPDQRDERKRHKRGQRHKSLPVVDRSPVLFSAFFVALTRFRCL